MAAESEAAIGETINVLDDEEPTQREYAKQLKSQVPNPPMLIPMNWMLMRSVGDVAWIVNQKLLGGKAKLPGVLIPSRLDARFEPLNYSNEKLKTRLEWEPRYDLRDAIARSLDDHNHFKTDATPQLAAKSISLNRIEPSELAELAKPTESAERLESSERLESPQLMDAPKPSQSSELSDSSELSETS